MSDLLKLFDELPRIPIPRTPVNKGKKKDRSRYAPAHGPGETAAQRNGSS